MARVWRGGKWRGKVGSSWPVAPSKRRVAWACSGTPADNSGVFVRFPDPGDDPWVGVNQGYEIQIDDLADPLHRTGAIYGFQAPITLASKPVGEWNTFDIRVVGQQYSVALNGTPVTEFTGDRHLEGFVGLQNHDPSSRVAFRDIRIRGLP